MLLTFVVGSLTHRQERTAIGTRVTNPDGDQIRGLNALLTAGQLAGEPRLQVGGGRKLVAEVLVLLAGQSVEGCIGR